MATLLPYKKVQRQDGGFDFFNGNNKIDVNQYVQGTGTDKNQLVQDMANSGDRYSQSFMKMPTPVRQNLFTQDAQIQKQKSNIASPNSIVSDLVNAGTQVGKGIGDFVTGTVNDFGNRIADAAQANATNIREITGQNAADSARNQNYNNEAQKQDLYLIGKIKNATNPQEKTKYQDLYNKFQNINSNVNDAYGQTVSEAQQATDPRKTITNAVSTALDVATAGKGSAILDGIKSTAVPVTKQLVGQLIKNTGKTALEGGGIGAAYGANETAKNKDATISDYIKNSGQGALLGATVGVGAQVALPVAGKVISGLANLPKDIRTKAIATVADGQNTVKIPTTKLVSLEGAPDRARVNEYKARLQNGGQVEPLTVMPNGKGTFSIEDGKHRFQAMQELGMNTANVRVVTPAKLKAVLQGGYTRIPGKEPTPSNKAQRQMVNNSMAEQNLGNVPLSEVSATQKTVGKPTKELNKEAQSAQAVVSSPSLTDPLLEQSLGSKKVADKSQLQVQKELPNQQQVTNGEVNPLHELKTRGFIESIKNDVNTPQKVKDSISSLYSVRNTKELQLKAANLVKSNPDLAQHVAMSNTGDVSQMVGSELIKHHNAKGNIENSIALAQEIAQRATEHGQASQALSAYSKLTPEGILRFTQKEINRFNKDNNVAPGKQIKLTPEKAKSLTDQSAALQTMPEGRVKDMATQKMLNDVKEILPAGWVKKVSALQTIGQLLNPKTAIRNVLGNAIFGSMDNVSQIGAAGIDKLTSMVKGTERTTALPNLITQGKGIVKGSKEAAQELWNGVNLGPDTQYELSQVPVFKSELMKGIEDTLGYILRVPDRAAYTAAFDDTIKGLMKVNKLDKPTQAIIEQANANGLYKTFQDNSNTAKLFSGIKKALNYVGVEKNGTRFGLGDLILKYPKTPGNIVSRGLDYSPVGIFRGLYQIVKPAITKQPFNQHTFANAISRGTVGTAGLIGAGTVLGALGIITEKPSSDTDTRNLQKASGQGGYQINVDALRRFFMSGFNKDAAKLQPGDTLVSYDWAQPLSIPLSAGAAIGKGQNVVDGATSTVENLTSGLNTLVEQPLISGVNTFSNNIKNKGVVGALGETVKDMPASFVPTFSNQLRQLSDNTTRSTYDPNATQTSLNKVINKIPGVETILQPQVDVLGNNKENYQNDSNNIFNVMFNPAFVSKYNPNAAANLPLDMLKNSGETQQMPRTTSTTQTVSGANIKLTPQQNHDFQQYVGQHTSDYYNQLMNNPTFMAKPDSEKAKIMSNGLSDISKAGKIVILGDTSKATVAQHAIANGGTTYKSTSSSSASGATPAEKYQAALDEYNTNQGAMSDIGKYAAENSLKRLKVAAPFSSDVVDLYGMSKEAIYNFVSNNKDGKKLVDQITAYDKALKDAGIISSLKFKNGIAPVQNGSSSKSKAPAGLSDAMSTSNSLKVPKFTKSNISSKPSQKKYTLKTYTANKSQLVAKRGISRTA